MEALRSALLEKEVELGQLRADLAHQAEESGRVKTAVEERDGEIQRLGQALQAQEQELVNKTSDVARLSIQSHLGIHLIPYKCMIITFFKGLYRK